MGILAFLFMFSINLCYPFYSKKNKANDYNFYYVMTLYVQKISGHTCSIIC